MGERGGLNNPEGRNGVDNGTRPSNEQLLKFFNELATHRSGAGESRDRQKALLSQEYGYHISSNTTLANLKKECGFVGPREGGKNFRQAPADLILAIQDVKKDDAAGRLTVANVRSDLAQRGVITTRSSVRSVMHAHYDDEFTARMRQPGRGKVVRGKLDAEGPGSDGHFDGHEDSGTRALAHGRCGFEIYAGKDKWARLIPHYRVLPNSRNQIAIGFYFLELTRKYNLIWLNMVVDGGTETGIMEALRAELIDGALMDMDTEVPGLVRTLTRVKSVHNTPAEGIWGKAVPKFGTDLKRVLLECRQRVDLNLPWHTDLFHWVFLPVVEHEWSTFINRHNKAVITKQPDILLPSGEAPETLWRMPSIVSSDRRQCGLPVSDAAIDELWRRYGGDEARDAAFAFYSADWDGRAQVVYDRLLQPERRVATAWTVFENMRAIFAAEPGLLE